MKRTIVKRKKRIAKAAIGPYALEVFSRLKREYPDAHTELDYQTPLQLLIVL